MKNVSIIAICMASMIHIVNAALNTVPGSMLKRPSVGSSGKNITQESYDWRYDPSSKDENGNPYPTLTLTIDGELKKDKLPNNGYLSISIDGSALQILFEFKSGLTGYEVNVKGFSINSYSGFKVDDWKKVLAQIAKLWQNDSNSKIGRDYTSKTLTKLKQQLVKCMELKKPLFTDQNQREMYNKTIQELIAYFRNNK